MTATNKRLFLLCALLCALCLFLPVLVFAGTAAITNSTTTNAHLYIAPDVGGQIELAVPKGTAMTIPFPDGGFYYQTWDDDTTTQHDTGYIPPSYYAGHNFRAINIRWNGGTLGIYGNEGTTVENSTGGNDPHIPALLLVILTVLAILLAKSYASKS